MGYSEMVTPTQIENWSQELLGRSIKTMILRLTTEEARALRGLNSYALEMGDEPPQGAKATVDAIRQRIDEAAKEFPGGFFVRLGSRSPKDSWDGIRGGFLCRDGARAIHLLCDSERVCDDLGPAIALGISPAIVLREWMEIPEAGEFRTFVRDGRLVGISQYFYEGFYPEIARNEEAILKAIQEESERVIPLLPAKNMIVDYIVGAKRAATGEVLPGAVLLEINPFFGWTDPCLFDWQEDKFTEFEFRYNKEPVKKEEPDFGPILVAKG